MYHFVWTMNRWQKCTLTCISPFCLTYTMGFILKGRTIKLMRNKLLNEDHISHFHTNKWRQDTFHDFFCTSTKTVIMKTQTDLMSYRTWGQVLGKSSGCTVRQICVRSCCVAKEKPYRLSESQYFPQRLKNELRFHFSLYSYWKD